MNDRVPESLKSLAVACIRKRMTGFDETNFSKFNRYLPSSLIKDLKVIVKSPKSLKTITITYIRKRMPDFGDKAFAKFKNYLPKSLIANLKLVEVAACIEREFGVNSTRPLW